MPYKAFTYRYFSFALSLLASCLLFVSGLQASAENAETDDDHFNAGEMIMEAIADAHEIHIIGDFAIYLPVILYTNDGFDIFSSKHFYHPEKDTTNMEGLAREYTQELMRHKNYIMLHEHIYYANAEGGLDYDPETGAVLNEAPFDISITKNVAGMFLTGLIMILVFGSVARAYKRKPGQAPKGLQSFMEPLILFVRDEVAIPSIGPKKAERFMPFLLSIFFFIWIANMLGLIPFIGEYNVTGTIAITLVLAGLVFIITTFSGNRHYWGHILWPAGVPILIKVIILVPVEILGIFIKPTVLMIRLTANMTAGHIIILSLVSLIFIFGQNSAIVGYSVGLGSTLFMIFMYLIKFLVAFLQAYVFTLLAALYFGDAVQDAHH